MRLNRAERKVTKSVKFLARQKLRQRNSLFFFLNLHVRVPPLHPGSSGLLDPLRA